MKTRLIVIVAVGIVSITPATGGVAQQGEAGRRFGVAVAVGVVGAPLGSVADSYGLFAVPGFEFAAHAVAREEDGREWSLGVIGDTYSISVNPQPPEGWNYEHSSIAAVGVHSWLPPRDGPLIRYGPDVGVRRFTASGTRPGAHEGESQRRSVNGAAGPIAVSYGVEIPSGRFLISPRL